MSNYPTLEDQLDMAKEDIEQALRLLERGRYNNSRTYVSWAKQKLDAFLGRSEGLIDV